MWEKILTRTDFFIICGVFAKKMRTSGKNITAELSKLEFASTEERLDDHFAKILNLFSSFWDSIDINISTHDKKTTSLSKSNLVVQESILSKNFIFRNLSLKNLDVWQKKFAELSKLHSTCPHERF